MKSSIKNILMATGLVLSLGALGGCKDDFDKAMDEASGLTDKMCGCKDEKCAEKVREERSAMKKRLRSSLEGKKPSEEQMKRAMKIDEKWRTCADKAEGHS